MRHLAIIIGLIVGSCAMQAQTITDSLNQIITHSYDSIRNEMIRTACKIEHVKDSVMLKSISANISNIVLSEQSCSIDKPLEQGMTTESYFTKSDERARQIRATLMGWLLIQNYRNENEILSGFDIHKNEINTIKSEIDDFLNARESGNFIKFSQKHPNSKFIALIPNTSQKTLASWKKWIPYFIICAIILVVMSVMAYTIYRLKKNNRTLSSMQQLKIDERPEECSSKYINTDNAQHADQEKQQQQCSPDNEDDGITDSSEAENEIEANAFAISNDNCVIVGASVIGNSHTAMGLPCQDNCKYAYIKDGWGIAIVSDGAGSAKHSEIGSRIIVERGIYYFKSIISQKHWIEERKLPNEAEWTNIAYVALKAIRNDLESFANTKNLDFNSLSATIIVVIHSPFGFLTTHIGDGRAGYMNDAKEWKAFFTPHKGEEANQTIFLTSDFWKVPYYVMSGVMVPESHVVRCNPAAFTLMSDGCEHIAWQCNMKHENTEMFYDPNKPYEQFFNPLIADLSNRINLNLRKRWAKFIMSGNNAFKNEPDDKTMILGVIK